MTPNQLSVVVFFSGAIFVTLLMMLVSWVSYRLGWRAMENLLLSTVVVVDDEEPEPDDELAALDDTDYWGG